MNLFNRFTRRLSVFVAAVFAAVVASPAWAVAELSFAGFTDEVTAAKVAILAVAAILLTLYAIYIGMKQAKSVKGM